MKLENSNKRCYKHIWKNIETRADRNILWKKC